MIISKSQIQRTMALYAETEKRLQTKKPAPKSKAQDELSLSNSGKEVQQILDELKRQPQVRSNLVEELRAEIREGRYNPKGEDVAAKILGRSKVDRLV